MNHMQCYLTIGTHFFYNKLLIYDLYIYSSIFVAVIYTYSYACLHAYNVANVGQLKYSLYNCYHTPTIPLSAIIVFAKYNNDCIS